MILDPFFLKSQKESLLLLFLDKSPKTKQEVEIKPKEVECSLHLGRLSTLIWSETDVATLPLTSRGGS